ncbi:aminoglycoside phosphotransferase family protein [Shewanella woodyi]|uniref:Aminoglycoside phosphotransferase n=1 Tax=Shewanella woodyi (strain ATCC 51908 / MS32) TaxID=392500 RepID=B1KGI3_SHEWM|nr:phosphotransferase [Shewanella woodyi]ACA85311.1 aminoglycoside phosphotransferase [Shewanella woodyi ATCC 51908]
MPLSDLRFLALNAWLKRIFNADVTPTLISGDASFRRYFRVQHKDISYIVMDSPPELIKVLPFVNLANAYSDKGVDVPQVIEVNAEDGFLLLSDLGDIQLLSVLNSDNVYAYYRDALRLLDKVSLVIDNGESGLPLYDAAFVQLELDIFSDWLIKRHLVIELDEKTQNMLKTAFSFLIENVEAQPKVGMHRDYHSRNLMLQNEQLKVIDFQDAVLGPVTYDAVSLLRDCYVRWPDALVEQLMTQHFEQVKSSGQLDRGVSIATYTRWFDLMGLQRHIKAAGIFSRLKYRDDKPAYMADIPLTLEYIRDISARYPELEIFSAWIADSIIPAVEAKL